MTQPKDMDERFDELFVQINGYRVGRRGERELKTYEAWKEKWDGGDQETSSWLTPDIIKTFLRKELADQKARAIEIARDNPCKMSGRIPHNHTATCNRAIATALEEKL